MPLTTPSNPPPPPIDDVHATITASISARKAANLPHIRHPPPPRPVAPRSAFDIFYAETLPSLGTLKLLERKRTLEDMWGGMRPAGRARYMEVALEEKAIYDDAMVAFWGEKEAWDLEEGDRVREIRRKCAQESEAEFMILFGLY